MIKYFVKGNLNKPINQLTKEDLSSIRLISFDSDGVTVKKGTEFLKHGEKLEMVTNPISLAMIEKIKKLEKFFWINFTSGRNLDFLKERYKQVISDKISLQAEIGNITWIKGKEYREIWSPQEIELVERIKERLIGGLKKEVNFKSFEPKEMIITIHARAEIPLVEEVVKIEDRENQLYCWWNGEAYDVGLRRINKGYGVKNLINILGIKLSEVMTVGNGINDYLGDEVVGLDISTDPKNLSADFVISGEELGGEVLINKILTLVE